VAGLIAIGALALFGKACSDLTAPTGVNTVSVQFQMDPLRPDSLFLIVGDSVRPSVTVLLGSVPQERARYVFSSSDPSVVQVYAGGDSITVVDRGSVSIIATLVGTTIGNNNKSTNTKTADTILVVSAALTNTVTPATVTFDAIGAKRMLTAQSFGRDPNVPIQSQVVVWRSANTAVATVDAATGEVTAAGNGTADIYAIFEGVDSTFSRVTVLQQLKRYILTTPSAANLRSINETMQVTARAVDSLSNNIGAGAPVPPQPAFVSDNPGKVEIDPATGVMTARSNTTDTPVKITATLGGATRSDTLQATVTQVAASLAIQSADTVRLLSIGDRVDLNVLAPDALGTQVPPSNISWTSADPSRAQVVGSATGTIIAQATGTVVVRARSDAQIDSVIVVITNDPDRVTLTPNPLDLRSLDETQQMTATVTNAAGTTLTGVPVTWASRDSAIAQPQPTQGLIRARAVGVTRIVVATPTGRSDSVTVRVTNAPDTVNIIPTVLTLASIGDVDGTFAVDFKNARGVALPRTAVNWSSQDITIARVLDGVITAVGAGATYIVAVSPENALRRDSVRVNVTNGAASVSVSPATPAALTAIGATISFSATVRNAAGNPVSGAPVTWSVVAGGAFVSIDANTGVATALGNGAATIRATSGVATGDANVTVGQVASLSQSTVIPAAATLVANGTSSTTIAIQLRDANGNNLTFGGSTIVPTATRGTLGAVTDNGAGSYSVTLTTGTTAGPANVSATANGQTLQNTGLVSFTAGAASQYVVTVSPSLTPLAGAPVTISARLADGFGNSVGSAGNVVTWSSTGGGSFASPTSTTDGTGLATVSFTTSNTATQHTVTATTGAFVGTSPAINPQAGGATQYVVTPATASPAAGTGVVISAQLLDASNNPVFLAGQTVTWTKSDANGSFSAPTSVTNGSGVATVTLITHTVSNTATTVTATSAGPLTGTSTTITTVPGAVSQLTLTQAPTATAQSGVAFAIQPTVQLRDVNGNAVIQANVSVVATITAGGGTLGGVTMVQTDATGLATFTDLAISGANGGRTITFSTSGASGATAGVTLGAGQAAQMALFAGNGQSAPAGTSVAVAPSAIVRDASNNAVTGVNVTFTVTGGSGTTTPPSGSTVATDASGVATLTSWTLGAPAGTNTLTASVAGLTGSPVTFTATGTAGVATQMTTSVGAQTATVNTPVPTDPSVLVRDANNNPIAGVSVTFTVTSGGGSISSPTGSTVVTNASGIAALSSWTLGTIAGANSLDATSPGLPTATFTATGTAGPATHVTVNGGNGQSAIVGTSVGTPPSALVRDAHNNPVAGTNVTFTVTGGGGTTTPASGSTIATGALGIASLTSWTLGTTSGANSLSAASAGLIGNPVTFTATGLVNVVTATQSSVLRTGGDNVTSNGSAASEITVTLRDQFNNLVAGRTVSLDDAGSTSVISAPSGTTSNALGEVRFVVTNTTPETVTYTATANDPGAIVITQTAQVTFQPGAPIIFASSGTSQNAVIGTNVAAPPAVIVRDGASNPLPGVSVTFTLGANGGGGASINPASPATVVTDASGIAALTSWTLGQTPGTNNNSVTASAPGVLGSPVTFTASGDNPDPDLTSIAPMSGIQGQTAMQVVLTGTGFISSSTVSFSSPSTGITINSTVVDSPTQITVTITIATTAATGTRNVRITNPGPGGGSSSDRLLSIVVPPVPTLASLAPASGARLATLNVVLTGTGFANGVSTVNVPAGFTLNSTVVNSATQITANVTIGAGAAFGANNFTVTNTPVGGTSVARTFTVDYPTPTLTGIAPAVGEILQTLNVVFTGTNFIAGVSSVNVGAGITVNSTTVNSATQITANLTITAAAATGVYSFSVSNAAPGGGTSATQAFTVTTPAPTLTGIAPASGERLATLNVVFTGTNFIAGVSSVNVGAGFTLNSTTVNSPTQITASITIGGTASTGAHNFSVTNAGPGGGTSADQSFTVTNPLPTLGAVSPTAGVQGHTQMQLVLTGTGFVSGSFVTFANPDIAINSTTVDSPTQITLSIDIGIAAAIGAGDVTVTNVAPGGGTSGAQSFSVNAPVAPTLTSIAPASGDRLQTLNVVFTGSDFASGVSSVNVPAGITVNSTTVDSPTQITANISIGAAATLGANSFTVTNTPLGGTSGAQTFTVSNPAPTVSLVSPNPVTTDLLLPTIVPSTTITGTGFISGVTTLVMFDEGLVTFGSITFDSPTQITVTNIEYPATLFPTTRTLRVTNAGQAPVTHTINLNP